ncbi:MAG TPA: DUF1549 domain-containing protein, partial [Gemmataceae bacterium]
MRSKFSALAVASIALPALWPAPCAAGEPHWAYVAPRRPAPPEVRRPGWAANPIDRFVLARLEREGLTPSPPADKARLLRRVHLDLTGLPPTPEQVDTFLADDRPDAYERVVEGLLASPAYGERWARPWLDAARHADSNGFQRDGFREVWPYRDWVVAAMNADVPFDRFTVEQIAGDLLPGADLGQKIATGFHRGTPVNVEAGVDQEENRVLAVIDRVNTTATVWLGTTMACAQCHDHKYDPFDQRDYYRLFAFFNNTPLETEGGEKARREFTGPKLTLPMPPERERRRREFAARREQLAAELGALRKEADAARPAWEEAARADAEGLKKLPAAVRRALALAPQKRNAKQREAVADYHLGLQPGAKELQEKLAALDKELDGLRP